MLFILFDVEVLFLYPVAVQLEAFGVFALVETLIFSVLLLVGFVYSWRRGALDWKRRLCDQRPDLPTPFVRDAAGFARGVPRAPAASARDMLRGDLVGDDFEKYVEESVGLTTLDKALNWARSQTVFPMTFGLACCAIEMMSIVNARYDVARFGSEAFRASPRQADLLILSGRVSIKMAPVIRRIYDQMLEPKWVIAMGACSTQRRRLQQLRRRPGRRQVSPDRRPRARLPAAPRGADVRTDQAAAQDQGQPRRRLARALRRARHRGVPVRHGRRAGRRRPRQADRRAQEAARQRPPERADHSAEDADA